jgi:hypothetical protein
MNLTPLFKRFGQVAAKNSPAILTSIGVTGAVASAYLAAKGAFQAAEILTKAQSEENEAKQAHALTTEEKFHLTWRCYIPAATCLVLSATAVICANRISDRRAAAMATAYSVVKESYTEYRAKTAQKVGPKKEQEIRDEIAQDRRERNPIDRTTLIVTGKGPTLIYDKWNDRYFTSSRNLIDAAVNELNREININGFATLGAFYRLLDVPAPGNSEYLGWRIDQLLEVKFSGTLDSDGEACLQMEFATEPDPKFDQAY